jgi:hypothetical protein
MDDPAERDLSPKGENAFQGMDHRKATDFCFT